ncbi:UDP-GalNAc:beta-1,3-N-acetylgalactosaminyltransferase 2 [Tetranychus urticae]|uniref:Hexosyltransferase n=1 Tax=Tetranychus urticae TaxID=32264 RepID=T1KEZ4_TETUR|nr:UDP-GalNAc:beta-1,3-N-acetylgalactosaminyltransferase 2 [Tetranychus urticae]
MLAARPGCTFFSSHWFVTALIVIISFFAYISINYHGEQEFINQNKTDLVGLVLSARSNFDKRNVLRETWFNGKSTYDTGNVNIKLHFIVGKNDCRIPIDYREDEYSCMEWVYNETEDCKTNVLSHDTESISYGNTFSSHIFRGFSFKVHQDILLKLVGCLFPCRCDTIILKNVLTQEILLNQSFVGEQKQNDYGFNYQAVAPILFLPKGFTGLLFVLNTDNLNCQPERVHRWNRFAKLTQILRVYKDLNDYESLVFHGEEIIMASFVIELADQSAYLKMIKDKEKNYHEFDKELSEIKVKLENELLEHEDIILVDVIDVYRNLPEKLVHAIAWTMTTENADLILKTDDDCFIDLANISHKINLLTERKSIWWGNFRHNMLVNVYGKWAENFFPGSVYPSFACGSGYIISSDIANWITMNKKFLHYFQGEDVSMGIWLSSIIPIYLMDRDWACAEDAPRDELLAYCQLNPSQLRQFHAMKSKNIKNN